MKNLFNFKIKYTKPEKEREWPVAPDVTPFAGNEQRGCHALDAHRAEVEGDVGRIGRRSEVVQKIVVAGAEITVGLDIALVDDGAPPILPFQGLDHGGVLFLTADKKGG